MLRKVIVALVVLGVALGIGGFIFMGSGEEGRESSSQAAEAQTPTPNNQKASQPNQAKHTWTKRCEKDSKYCEIFQRIIVKENQKRLVEFAIGFPNKESEKAQAALILPLGIMVAEGVTIQVQGTKEAKAPVKTCTEAGCLAVFEVPDDTLNAMINSDKVTILFKGAAGKPFQVIMSLGGFADELSKL
jgi:invasion protein IalB